MTLNNVIDLFRNIVTAHYNLRGFGFGNIFEQNGSLKEGLEYPLLWVVPLDSTPFLQTKQRRFSLIVVDRVKKDKSNRNEVWSDTEQTMDDIIKILRNESDDYELKNDPEYDPIDEQYADWVTGWAASILLETDLASNYCDIPADGLDMPVVDRGVTIYKNTDGVITVLTTLGPGQSYTVEELTAIIDTITGNSATLIDPIE